MSDLVVTIVVESKLCCLMKRNKTSKPWEEAETYRYSGYTFELSS